MNTKNLVLIGLFSLGIQACNVAQAQYSLTRDDFKHLPSRTSGTAPHTLQSPQDRSAQDSEFSEKFNKALSDAKRKDQEAQAQSLRSQMQHQEMRNSAVRSPHHRDASVGTGRTQIQFDGKGATACRKMESGQTRCEAQGQR